MNYPDFFYKSLLRNNPHNYEQEDYITWLIEQANNGYLEAKQELIKIAAKHTVKANFECTVIQSFLVNALNEISQGIPANKVFFQQNQGRGSRDKRFSDEEENKCIAYQVLERRELAHLFGKEPLTLEKCYIEVSEEFSISTDKVKSKYLEYKDILISEFSHILSPVKKKKN